MIAVAPFGLGAAIVKPFRHWLNAHALFLAPLMVVIYVGFLACYGVAVWSVLKDPRMPPRKRRRWLALLIFLNFLAGLVYVLRRGRQAIMSAREGGERSAPQDD